MSIEENLLRFLWLDFLYKFRNILYVIKDSNDSLNTKSRVATFQNLFDLTPAVNLF